MESSHQNVMCGVFPFSDRLIISHYIINRTIRVSDRKQRWGKCGRTQEAGELVEEALSRRWSTGPTGCDVMWYSALSRPPHAMCRELIVVEYWHALSPSHRLLSASTSTRPARQLAPPRPSSCRNVRAASAACRHACATLHRQSQLNNDPNIC